MVKNHLVSWTDNQKLQRSTGVLHPDWVDSEDSVYIDRHARSRLDVGDQNFVGAFDTARHTRPVITPWRTDYFSQSRRRGKRVDRIVSTTFPDREDITGRAKSNRIHGEEFENLWDVRPLGNVDD